MILVNSESIDDTSVSGTQCQQPVSSTPAPMPTLDHNHRAFRTLHVNRAGERMRLQQARGQS
jgi:hypothetical protein